jgi:hypothetical protein
MAIEDIRLVVTPSRVVKTKWWQFDFVMPKTVHIEVRRSNPINGTIGPWEMLKSTKKVKVHEKSK